MKTSQSWIDHEEQQEHDFENQRLWIEWIQAEFDACIALEGMLRKHHGYVEPTLRIQLRAKKKWLLLMISNKEETQI